MATVSLLGTGTFNTTAGSKTVTAVPTDGDLIVVVVATSGLAGGTTSVTDNDGGTYTLVDSDRTGFSTTGVLNVFIRDALITTASSTIFTAAQVGSTGGGLVVLRVTGVSKTGSAAVRSNGGQSTGTAATTPAPVLSNTPFTQNPIITAVANGTNSTTTVVQRTGYSEHFDNGYNSPATGLEVSSLNSGETSATITYGGNSASAFASVAIELWADLEANKSESVTVTESVTFPTIALTQAEAAFYEDGTESGSTVISAGADSITEDVSGGDQNLQLRVRLQETNGIAGAATDDYQLQYELNDSGSYSSVPASTIIDNHPLSAYDFDHTPSTSVGDYVYGQAFTGNGSPLVYSQFVVDRDGSPVGTITGTIYAHSGTFGTSSVGTGSPLATSTNSYAAGSIDLTQETLTFEFDGSFTPTNGTKYIVAMDFSMSTNNFSNTIYVRTDNTSPSHAGNSTVKSTSGSWSSNARDVIFEVGTQSPVIGFASASLTDGNATTNRLGSGSGSFVAGEISEDGLVDNLTITASNYTELLYSLTIDSASVADADTLDFRVLRNGATTGMTYTVTPRITISASSDPTINKSDTATLTESVTVFRDSTNVSVSDTATLTEAVTVSIDNYIIDKSDTATLTESAQRQVENNIVEVDNATLTESTTLETTNFINKSDTTTVTESVTLIQDYAVNNSDTTTLTESTKLETENRVSVSDSSTVSDVATVSIEVVGDTSVSVSDTATVTESVQRETENRISVTENSTVTESVTVVRDNLIVSVTDTTTITESVQRMAENRVSVSDNSTVTESLQREATNRISVSDSSTVTELVVFETINTISKSENATLTEAITVFVPEHNITVSDTTTVAESFSASIANADDYNDLESESVSVTEAVTLLITELFISKSDTTTVTESVQLSTDNRIAVSDSTTLTENRTVLVNELVINKSDSVTVTESIQREVTNFVVKSDTTTVTDTPTVLISERVLNVSDTTTVTESVQRMVENRVSVFDATVPTDSPTVSITAIDDLAVNKSDTATLTESATVLIPELLINKSDSVAVTESVSTYQTNYNVNTSDTVTGTESTTLLIPELFVTETENVSTTENAIVTAGNQAFYNIITSESSILSEQVTAVMSDGLQSVSDTATLSESVSVSIQATITPTISVQDSTTVTESVVVQPPQLNVSKSESVTVTENRSITLESTDKNIVVSDSISGNATPNRKYYIDSDANVYWVTSQALGLVEKV